MASSRWLFVSSMAILLVLPGTRTQLDAKQSRSSDAAVSGFPVLGEILGDSVYVRAGPSRNHHPVSKLSRFSGVVVLARSGDWYEIHLPRYETCWIHGNHVELRSSADGRPRLAVIGNSVNLRPTAAVKFTVIGQVGRSDSLVPTGRKSADKANPDEVWYEIQAPLAAHVFVHKNFLGLRSRVQADGIARLVQRLGPGSPRVAEPEVVKNPSDPVAKPVGGSATSGAGKTAPASAAAIDLPAFISDRLRAVYDDIVKEYGRDPIQWNFDSILRDLRRLESSEDAGEIKYAQVWADHIRTQYLPVARALVDAEKKRQIARARQREGVGKEKEIPKAITPTPKDRGKYLAKGWVFAMGKNSKVKGTHKLMKGNKLLFYLRSDSIDLDKLVYKRIGVQGNIENLDPELGARLIVVTGHEILSH